MHTLRISIALGLALTAGQASLITTAAGGTYNGPDDPAAYREPRVMRCFGVPEFPQYYRADVKGEMIGNLVDGYNYVELEGKIGILYFDLVQSEKDRSRLEATYTKISTLDWKRQEAKGHCIVDKWKPLRPH